MNSQIDDIVIALEEMVQKKIPLSPNYWLEQAEKMVVLMGEETDELYKLQKEVANERVKYIEQGKSVSEAKIRVEASDLYENMLKQKAKLEKINEIIRIAKIQARQRNEEYFGNKLN